MLSSEQLKKIRAEARPFIKRQMEDGKVIAGFRDVVSAAGGDWSALKAVIKAEIQDEDDEAGERKKVGKVVGKAEWTRIYADMLGLSSNLNEENSFADESSENPAFDKWLEDVADRVDPALLMQLIDGSKTAAGRAIIMAAIQVVRGDRAADAETGEIIEPVQKMHKLEPQPVVTDQNAEANTAQTVTAHEPVVSSAAEPEAVESSAPISQPADSSPAVSDEGGVPSASLVAANSDAPVTADRTKAHPWCRDPDDCGVHGSWNFMCGECLRRGAESQAAEALQ